MKRISAFRSAAVLLVVFGTMHTVGGLLAQQSLGPQADAVFASMKSVHFVFNGADCTWHGFWFGFGLTVSVFLFLSAVIAWQLDSVPCAQWAAVSAIAGALVMSHLVHTILAWKYFFAGPGIFGILITALLTLGWIQKALRPRTFTVGPVAPSD